MHGLGTIINTLAILAGGALGALFGRFLKESAQDKKVHPNLWPQEMKGNLRKHKVIVNGLKFFVVLKLRKKHSKQRK